MLRLAPRQVLRQSALPVRAQRLGVRQMTTGPMKRRSFKNTLARWGIAIGGIYWYNTSPIFNEAPSYTIQDSGSDSEDVFPTYASVAASSIFRPPHPSDAPIVPSTPSVNSPPSINPKSPDPRNSDALSTTGSSGEQALSTTNPDSLEQEASQQGAFNEETGEINWDCPCLGGMAHGPCGEEFRAAFSCFVYSDKEPKGIDCVDKFEGMQTCFRAHPEVYASEIEDDENMQQELEQEVGRGAVTEPTSKGMPDVDQPSVWTPVPSADDAPKTPAKEAPSAATSAPKPKAKAEKKIEKKPVYDSKPKQAPKEDSGKSEIKKPDGSKAELKVGTEASRSESESVVPKAAHDAR